jgi:hypothetical protein
MTFPSAGQRKHPFRIALALLPAVLLCAFSAYGQAKDAGSAGCVSEIPVGVKVIKLPDAEQHRVTISEFSMATNKDAATYDLSMRVKNGTDSWCVTSLGLTYLLGDARGQEWLANEYPAVLEFRTQQPLPPGHAKTKTVSAAALPAHGVSLAPGGDEKRVVFDLYDYIQPRPSGYFDGFHLISAEVKYCMGYALTKSQ